MTFKLEFPHTDEEYAAQMAAQKKHALVVAEKLSAGTALESHEAAFAAIVLRDYSEKLSLIRKKPKGPPRKVNASSVALTVQAMVEDGMSEAAAKGKAAELFDVDIDTIGNAMKDKGKDAKAYFAFVRSPNKSAD